MMQMPRTPATGLAHEAGSKGLPLVRGVAFLALGLLLTACVEDTGSVSVAPAPGASAASAIENFVITVATADVIGDNCGAAGIAKGYSSMDALLDGYVRNLQRAGYDGNEVLRAVDGLNYDRVGNTAITRLKARGVRQGDTASLCRYGRDEIARGSAIGKLLKVTG
jgi:Family of unknown function (DUF5333)